MWSQQKVLRKNFTFAYLCWFFIWVVVVVLGLATSLHCCCRFFSTFVRRGDIWQLVKKRKELDLSRGILHSASNVPVKSITCCWWGAAVLDVEMLIGAAVNDKVDTTRHTRKERVVECYRSRPHFPSLILEFSSSRRAHTTMTLTDGWLNYLWIPKIHWLSLSLLYNLPFVFCFFFVFLRN